MEVLNNHSNERVPQMNQNGQRHRNGDHLTPPGTMELEIGLDRKPSRSRSNSKVYRSAVSPFMNNSKTQNGSNNTNNITSMPSISINNQPESSATSSSSSISSMSFPTSETSTIHSREKCTYILKLSSLNETFDRKTLTIPVYPEVLKLGRPNSSQKAPSIDNGYFDSKVISRDQAELYVKEDQVYIRDTNSSNGTFVNTKKILKEEAIKENDVIDLGIDIDANPSKHQHHRKISCKVENVFIVPLTNGVSLPQVLNDLNNHDKAFKQKEVTPFDAAFFGDVNSDLDDLALGMNHDFLSGIFVNNNIGTSSNLTKSVKILMNQLHQEKINNLKLQSVEKFLENYRVELSRNEQTAKIRKLNKELSEHKKLLEQSNNQISQFDSRLMELHTQLETHQSKLSQKDLHIRELEGTLQTHNENRTKELDTKIESLQGTLKSKQFKIEELEYEQKRLKSNYESDLKSLEEKISKDTEKYDTLNEKYQNLLERKNHDELKKDTYSLIFISIGVLIVGLLVLKVF